jgi:hypothetical protein
VHVKTPRAVPPVARRAAVRVWVGGTGAEGHHQRLAGMVVRSRPVTLFAVRTRPLYQGRGAGFPLRNARAAIDCRNRLSQIDKCHPSLYVRDEICPLASILFRSEYVAHDAMLWECAKGLDPVLSKLAAFPAGEASGICDSISRPV